jgi:hypothetical protein
MVTRELSYMRPMAMVATRTALLRKDMSDGSSSIIGWSPELMILGRTSDVGVLDFAVQAWQVKYMTTQRMLPLLRDARGSRGSQALRV